MINLKSAELINIDEKFDEAVGQAKKLYLEGGVFAYPTDTIYGFGGNPFNDSAIDMISEIKKREHGKNYLMLIGSMEYLLKYVDVTSERHLDFLVSIWPNPVSVVLKLKPESEKILNMETAAFRIPNHRFCLKLLSELKMPLISTSVNRRDEKPMTEYSVIKEEFSSEIDAIFYTSKKSFYEASTLIDLSGSEPALLREGRMKFKDLMEKYR